MTIQVAHKVVTAELAIAAAGAYAVGNILSDHASAGQAFLFEDVLGQFGQGGWITKAILTDSQETAVFESRLWLFSSDPTASNKNDRVAKSIAEADRYKVVDYIDFKALAPQGAISLARHKVLEPTLPMEYYIPSGTSMWGLLEILAVATLTAGSTLGIALHLEN